MKTAKGFTLLEVLVALVVLALVMAGVMSFTARHSMNIQYLRDRSIAHWVAMNELVRLQLQDELPDTGSSSGEASMAGRTWFWHQKVESTPDDAVRRVWIEVAPQADFEQALSSLWAFVGETPPAVSLTGGEIPQDGPTEGPENSPAGGPDSSFPGGDDSPIPAGPDITPGSGLPAPG
ncbi:MAG: type II secretion system minor pseudopilin GspI [gamma proteobacterium symbiont of Bathyaustriella thionipta]|nr:type II secretion system minor pseudopilin GspI [gamma proteobacterium symbiont of Bathyaustriella thionipta]